MTLRLAALSVDLDEIPNYFGIHGLPLPAGDQPGLRAVYDVALERMDAFARAYDLPLTLFAIGADLARPSAAASLWRMADRGHAIENHSLDHRYDLTRLSRSEVRSQIEGGADAIERATGRRPTGFRAPGYTIDDEVFDVLEELGFAFDSSVFPCPAYYGAKALVLGVQRLIGRSSRSVLDVPRVLTAPTRPYRPGKPYQKRGDRSLVELPIQVTKGLRLPFIGTSVALARPFGARLLARQVIGEPFVNLELHGIDFLGYEDGLEALRGHQPELERPLEERMRSLGEAVRTLRDRGYAFVRLDEAAARVSRELQPGTGL